jgi:hypothetical protein
VLLLRLLPIVLLLQLLVVAALLLLELVLAVPGGSVGQVLQRRPAHCAPGPAWACIAGVRGNRRPPAPAPAAVRAAPPPAAAAAAASSATHLLDIVLVVLIRLAAVVVVVVHLLLAALLGQVVAIVAHARVAHVVRPLLRQISVIPARVAAVGVVHGLLPRQLVALGFQSGVQFLLPVPRCILLGHCPRSVAMLV